MNYNQNDSLYKSVMLGFSKKYSLFSDGCYVFALAGGLGIDPIECNDRLKNAGAFMANSEGDVCLLDHTKIVKAFPNRVVSVAKYDSYDNDACLEAIDKNGWCIVKVDFDGSNSTTMDTHFVRFVGNKKLFDSLGGKLKPTSTYPILKGLRVVTLKEESPTSDLYKGYDLNNVDSNKVAIDKLVDIMEGKYISIEEHNKVINELDAKSTAMAQSYEKEKNQTQEKIRTLEDIIRKYQEDEHSWSDVADGYQRKLVGVLGAFLTVGVSLSTEMDKDDLVNAVYDYLSSDKKTQQDVLDLQIKIDNANTKLATAQEELEFVKNDKGFIGSLNFGSYIIKIYSKK